MTSFARAALATCAVASVLGTGVLGVGAFFADTAHARSVRVGGEPNLDACSGFGRVVNLNSAGDNYPSVRSRPSMRGRELDQLGPGAVVHMCDRRGRWIGIVCSPNGCGVATPIPRREAYRGPCRSGSALDRYVRLVAG